MSKASSPTTIDTEVARLSSPSMARAIRCYVDPKLKALEQLTEELFGKDEARIVDYTDEFPNSCSMAAVCRGQQDITFTILRRVR